MSAIFSLSKTIQNLIRYSEDITTSPWVSNGGVFSPNTWIVPNGTLTGDEYEDISITVHQYPEQIIYGLDCSDYYSFSGYIKKDNIYKTTRFIGIYLIWQGVAAEYHTLRLDTSTGEFVTTVTGGGFLQARVVDVGVAWKCELTMKTENPLNSYVNIRYYAALGNDLTMISSTPLITGSTGVWGSQFNKGVLLNPYYKTEATALTAESDFMPLEPEFNYSDGGAKIEDVHVTKDGGEYRYKWGSYDLIEFGLMHLTATEKDKINGWWSSNEDLIFTDHITAISRNVHIANKKKPITSPVKPYYNQFKGKLQLRTYE